MKIIKGNLILEKDTVYNESLTVEGNIIGKDGRKFDLRVEGNIDARDINAYDVKAFDVKARDLNACDVKVCDLNACDLNAKNVNAKNLNTCDINAWSIKAKNINYYAVCFAYNNIVCKSIKGRRNNNKHFCLDGKITIKEETPKIIEVDGNKYKLVEE